MRNVRSRHARGLGLAITAVAVLSLTAAACGSSSKSSTPSGGTGNNSGTAGLVAPTRNLATLQSIGKGEGKLNVIAWEGYTEPSWVKPFEKQTGCQVNAKFAGTSSEMVSLMAKGGGGQYDLVSASGDADLRLIYGGDVRPVNIDLIPSWKDFHPFLQSPSFNTIDGKHYGVSLQFGPNVLLYSKAAFPTAPTSWSTIYSKQYSGKITVPNNPIQIADAALYLSKTQPSLGITDPYELTQDQFQAAVELLKAQQPWVGKYWSLYSDEIDNFKSGATVVGTTWPYQYNALLGEGVKVGQAVPTEGMTGWADTWMMSSHASHPNCMQKWMAWMITPEVQAQVAEYFGEAPANPQACKYLNATYGSYGLKDFCQAYRVNDPSFYNSIAFWKTPLADCGDSRGQTCVDYSQWTQAWTEIKG
jgi:putative spermidine/putrescine transport system substrate-binding protein